MADMAVEPAGAPRRSRLAVGLVVLLVALAGGLLLRAPRRLAPLADERLSEAARQLRQLAEEAGLPCAGWPLEIGWEADGPGEFVFPDVPPAAAGEKLDRPSDEHLLLSVQRFCDANPAPPNDPSDPAEPARYLMPMMAGWGWASDLPDGRVSEFYAARWEAGLQTLNEALDKAVAAGNGAAIDAGWKARDRVVEELDWEWLTDCARRATKPGPRVARAVVAARLAFGAGAVELSGRVEPEVVRAALSGADGDLARRRWLAWINDWSAEPTPVAGRAPRWSYPATVPSRPVGEGLSLVYNPRLAPHTGPAGVKLPVRRVGLTEPERLVVAATATGELDSPTALSYPYGGRCLVLGADGALRLLTRGEAGRLRLDPLHERPAAPATPLFDLAGLPRERTAVRQALGLTRDPAANAAAPWTGPADGPVAWTAQWRALQPGEQTAFDLLGEVRAGPLPVDQAPAALGLPAEVKAELRADDPPALPARLVCLNVGPFQRVDLLLEPDGLTCRRFLAMTHGAVYPAEELRGAGWTERRARHLWRPLAAKLKGPDVPADRTRIKPGAALYCLWSDAYGLESVLETGSTGLSEDDMWNRGVIQGGQAGRYRCSGRAVEAELILVAGDWREKNIAERFYGGAADGGWRMIAFAESSVAVAILDAREPGRVLFRKRLSARPKVHFESTVTRATNWQGEIHDAGPEVREALAATLRSLGLVAPAPSPYAPDPPAEPTAAGQ